MEVIRRVGFVTPEITELVPNVSQTGVVTAVVKAQKGQSVKVAVSTSAEPSAATVRAEGAQALDTDGILRTGTLATLTAGQTLYIAAFAYSNANGDGAESKLAAAKITHYEGGVTIEVVEKSRTAYAVTYRLTARDADGDTVKIHYRSVPVTTPSDDYASPAPTSEGGFSAQPHPLEPVLDRGLVDRYIEAWAEDVNGNEGPIVRLPLPAIASADQEAAITSFGASGAFGGTCPTRKITDTITWSEGSGVPTAWIAKLYVCEQATSGCTPPTTGPFNSDAQTGATRSPVGDPGITEGAGNSVYRKYRIRLENSYGDVVDDDVSSEISNTYDFC